MPKTKEIFKPVDGHGQRRPFPATLKAAITAPLPHEAVQIKGLQNSPAELLPNQVKHAPSLKRGWHASTGKAPRIGSGTATVEPIRRKRDISAIKGVLAHSPRDFALFVLGIHIGLRGGDLLALKWNDLLSPTREVAYKIKVIEQKTKKHREVALQPNARDAVKRWRDVARTTDGYVFPNVHNEPLTVQRLHQLVNVWARQANVRGHFGTHTLRKTYGYQLHKLGVGIVTLMKAFGHSSQAITLRYIGIEQEEIDEANLKLNL